MFLKSLTISSDKKVIRKIKFCKGINLIIGESIEKNTGYNVGKTTVLKVIDYCLGAKPENIYGDSDLVKDFLIKNEILVTLILTNSLDNENSEEIIIERNFLSRNKIIRKINGNPYNEAEFQIKLLNLIFPDQNAEKPTFRQIISHNIRYKDESIKNPLKTLHHYTTDVEYETLYLFLFGCEFNKGTIKQEIWLRLKQENDYKKIMEKQLTKTAYETTLLLTINKVEELEKQKANFNLNENFQSDLDKLNKLKYQINKISSEISKLNIRRNLILEAEQELNSTKSDIDLKQLQLIYQQATSQITGIQKTFDDLVNFHNQIIIEKVKFIKKELPNLDTIIQSKKDFLERLLSEERSLSVSIAKSDSFEDIEKIIIEQNENNRKKAEYETIISQIEKVENNIKYYTKKLYEIDDELFSDKFEHTVKTQLNKFNKHFASIYDYLYGEQYAIKYDIINNKKNQRLYKFTAFNTNQSYGQTQGEISCFDIAYILFADEENISCLHFLLNDKIDSMDDRQLVKIAELANQNNIQFVTSILKDRLPEELNHEEFFVLKLSLDDKLFRIENYEII